MNLGLNASGSESEEGEGGGRPLVLLVRINLFHTMFSIGHESFWVRCFLGEKVLGRKFL